MTRLAHHAEWLELIEISGPFLSLPVLERVFPQGLDVLETGPAAKLRLAREEWAEEQEREDPDPTVHEAWIRLVLGETLGYTPQVLLEGGSISALASEVKEHGETLRPDFALSDPSVSTDDTRTRLLIKVYQPPQKLDGIVEQSSWAASPAARMVHLCRSLNVRLGLVTNGEQWMLVDAPVGENAAYISWYAALWSQEPLTLRAFQSLLSLRRFFGVPHPETLEAMLVESASFQADVTEQLGSQVRRAVEVLVQALDRADADSGRTLLVDVSETDLYAAAITVMMRLVFLFFAEESELLPLGNELYQRNYAASTLRGQLREEADLKGLEVLERGQDAWNRLLATFRAIYGGIEHEALPLPPYGGSLFDPDRFPFLEGRLAGTTWYETDAQPLPIDNRTSLHLLDALQVLQMKGGRGTEARKLSFRSLDIEQIGHVYEMLLDHEVVRAEAPGIGLVGVQGTEPELSLDLLDERRDRGHDVFLDFLKKQTRRSRSSLEKALEKAADSGWVDRIRVACADDVDLFGRVLPYQALMRADPWGEPVIIHKGSVFVTAGAERRSTGTYYTPRALTEEVVTNALEPLVYKGAAEGKPRQDWKLKRPGEILELKVCDLAMGSGAFLVQVVRWLSDRLIEAWDMAEEETGPVTIEGEPTRGGPSEVIVPTNSEERRALARRVVADRSVYGVDVNPLAVEMAKLSLWLVTLAKGRPFSFLDHALKCGDSLLGVNHLDQIRHFHLNPDHGKKLHATLFDPTRHLEHVVHKALELRQKLESFTVRDVHDAEQKSELNRGANGLLEGLRYLGDLVVGAGVSTAGLGTEALDKKLQSVSDQFPSLLETSRIHDRLRTDALIMLNEGKPPLKRDRRTFHWPLEFPEVFLRDGRPGFDAILGNPPFKGGQKITGELGSTYREYLVDHLASGARGSADLAAYFFLRAGSLLADEGSVGLLATNTISQGNTREVGLDQLVEHGFTVVRAVTSRPWPGSVGVEVAEVWLRKGGWSGAFFLDDQEVPKIDSLLDVPSRVSGFPFALSDNADKSFQGSLVLGSGFILDAETAAKLIERNSQNKEVVLPYLNGEDLNSSPTQSPSRWVIYFRDWSIEEAKRYEEPLAVVEKYVRHERLGKSYSERAQKLWWQFYRPTIQLYKAIEGFSRVLVKAQVSSTWAWAFVSSGFVYDAKLIVFSLQDWANFASLQSSLHWEWSIKYGTTLRLDMSYTPTHCFETFPLPPATVELENAGERFHSLREEVMTTRKAGLTSVFHSMNDPSETSADIVELRAGLQTVDEAVCRAFGWTDLEPRLEFIESRLGFRYAMGREIRFEILSRLLELNYQLHAGDSERLFKDSLG